MKIQRLQGRFAFHLLVAVYLCSNPASAQISAPVSSDARRANEQHAQLNLPVAAKTVSHTVAPGAQWFSEADFGLFIHFGIASVNGIEISWPMIVGKPLALKRLSKPEIDHIVSTRDWAHGRPFITPNNYWKQADKFNPNDYDPDHWVRAAKDAGMTYAVLTTRHHEGFALWPSKYGDFSTKNYMGGRDLVRPFVEACRKYGLRVGLYYSPPDWHFDRDYMSFLYHGGGLNPEFPVLDADLQPSQTHHTPEETRAHYAAYTAYLKGQITELLSNYGKIDLLWFDGRPTIPKPYPTEVISLEEIHKLQPDIVTNPRLLATGDFTTFEGALPLTPQTTWGEYEHNMGRGWSYHADQPDMRAPAFLIGQLAKARALNVNDLLDVGPMSNGELPQASYDRFAQIADWMKLNRRSIFGAGPIPTGEQASVPATAAGTYRYLFLIPKITGSDFIQEPVTADETVTFKSSGTPRNVRMLASGKPLKFTTAQGELIVVIPSALRTNLVDVVQITMK